MNKIDLLILAGAGALVAAAGGLWFTHSQNAPVDVRILPDGREAHVTYPEGRQQGAATRMEVVDPKAGPDPGLQAFLVSAERFRAQPCSAAAKTKYLAAFRAHIRNWTRRAENPGDGSEKAQFSNMMAAVSHSNMKAIEIAEQLRDDGYVTATEHRNALRTAAPGMFSGAGPQEEEPPRSGPNEACERERSR